MFTNLLSFLKSNARASGLLSQAYTELQQWDHRWIHVKGRCVCMGFIPSVWQEDLRMDSTPYIIQCALLILRRALARSLSVPLKEESYQGAS